VTYAYLTFGFWTFKFCDDVSVTLSSNYLIKVTLGITGLLRIRAHINFDVWHLDVGFNFWRYATLLSVGELILL
jgi:hypothetical protein